MGVSEYRVEFKYINLETKKNTWSEYTTYHDKIWDAPLEQRGMDIKPKRNLLIRGYNFKDLI